nr:Cof-type HAD-IIB family hydrolase [Frisingicoccus sp.]
MPVKIHLAAMDIDGTLLGKNKNLTDYTIEVLNRAAASGMHIVIASGRALEAIPESLCRVGGIEYVITSNGSSVFSLKNRERIFGKDMTSEQILMILDFYRNYECPMEIFIKGTPYTSEEYFRFPEHFGAFGSAAEYVKTTRNPVKDIRAFAMEHKDEIEGINFIMDNMELKSEMRKKLEDMRGLYVTSSVPRYIEISHGDVCKYAALKWLAKKLNICPEEIIAFGDGENDLEMIQYAGIGVAMENGIERLKKTADRVAPSCDEDGVARVLEEIL